jgi:hypothetical protein
MSIYIRTEMESGVKKTYMLTKWKDKHELHDELAKFVHWSTIPHNYTIPSLLVQLTDRGPGTHRRNHRRVNFKEAHRLLKMGDANPDNIVIEL